MMQIRELRCEAASCSCCPVFSVRRLPKISSPDHPHTTQEPTALTYHTTQHTTPHHATPRHTTTDHNTPQHTTPTAAAVPQHTTMPRSPKSRSPRWTMTSLFSSGFSSSRRTAITTQRQDSVNKGATTASPELFLPSNTQS